MDGTIGEIRIIAANFAPRNWAYCQGQTLSIQGNTALFAILGTTYGGNGTTNFMLPNFAGRVALGVGQAPGGNYFSLGQTSGGENHTLISTEMPMHTHTGVASANASLMVSDADSTLAVATAGSVIATPGYMVTSGLAKTLGFNNATPNTVLHQDSIKVNNTTLSTAIAGGSVAHNNMQPYMAISHIICMFGSFPARN